MEIAGKIMVNNKKFDVYPIYRVDKASLQVKKINLQNVFRLRLANGESESMVKFNKKWDKITTWDGSGFCGESLPVAIDFDRI